MDYSKHSLEQLIIDFYSTENGNLRYSIKKELANRKLSESKFNTIKQKVLEEKELRENKGLPLFDFLFIILMPFRRNLLGSLGTKSYIEKYEKLGMKKKITDAQIAKMIGYLIYAIGVFGYLLLRFI